ncbi:nicotinate phosphoribosyltransferase [Lyngbya confervoides]|uniref:Nicotinate phosphoribosyltransferase n=1 Tax=Lyngbya confervoides BDU141951 TaxID=1574623 RepID=A0ABD4T6U7_9CYAN|nr:nicotinate phosphoribosyltransferase [Lyngbya confervoides]MCM1984486.1 nicotinate phosphoribosyltransferase [Lyngbya confervoides BDU141951]
MSLDCDPLLTDLYQLTMLDVYAQSGMNELAVFEFFVRRLPPQRQFLIAAGLEQVLQYLETLRFSAADLDWLAQSGHGSPALIDQLQTLRFTGSVHAVPEGTPVFAQEPLIRITAPLMQAQLVESRIINLLQFQTLIASKAARCVLAAPDKLLVDFGLRRAHGAEAGVLAARACYLAGFSGTATVRAGFEYGIPLFGTMAHSFIQAHPSEIDAFENFARHQPQNVILLIDTYDTEAGAAKVVEVAPKLKDQGIQIKAVRLDSGNLAAHARQVRAILDGGGLSEVGIFCSGGLDENALQALLSQAAPIDGFGLGTSLDTSSDAPYLDCAYKLQEYAGQPQRKRSEGKANWPGRKQVDRHYTPEGQLAYDILRLDQDPWTGTPLLQLYMDQGQRTQPPEPLQQVRRRTVQELQRLPAAARCLEAHPWRYRVEISDSLQRLAQEVDQALDRQNEA